jgi:hypothetical protein
MKPLKILECRIQLAKFRILYLAKHKSRVRIIKTLQTVSTEKTDLPNMNSKQTLENVFPKLKGNPGENPSGSANRIQTRTEVGESSWQR